MLSKWIIFKATIPNFRWKFLFMKIFLSNFYPFPINPELEKCEKKNLEKKLRGPSNIIFKKKIVKIWSKNNFFCNFQLFVIVRVLKKKNKAKNFFFKIRVRSHRSEFFSKLLKRVLIVSENQTLRHSRFHFLNFGLIFL